MGNFRMFFIVAFHALSLRCWTIASGYMQLANDVYSPSDVAERYSSANITTNFGFLFLRHGLFRVDCRTVRNLPTVPFGPTVRIKDPSYGSTLILSCKQIVRRSSTTLILRRLSYALRQWAIIVCKVFSRIKISLFFRSAQQWRDVSFLSRIVQLEGHSNAPLICLEDFVLLRL